jgi:mono/diheme cytochrome c family protein
VSEVIASAAIAAVLVALAACSRAAPLQPAHQPEDKRTQLREEVRAIARPHCGSCHAAPGKPKALAVFDLGATEFARALDKRQLQVFIDRIDGKLSDADRKTVRAYLAAEAASR